MPRKQDWIHRLPEILSQLEDEKKNTLLDRSAIEKIFRVSPRQANRILHQMGAEKAGGALLIGKRELQAQLSRLQNGESATFENRRRARLHSKLEEARIEARRRRIVIPQTDPAATYTLQSLPEGVQLTAGLLNLHFSDPVDLLQKLMFLAKAIGEDWDEVAELTSKPNFPALFIS